nr:ribonuclease H-like domain-containing protein [Tanacetum cinerariifolium]
IFVVRDSSKMFLSQCKYAAEILKRAYVVNYNPSQIHVHTESKPRADGDRVFDLILYHSPLGDL